MTLDLQEVDSPTTILCLPKKDVVHGEEVNNSPQTIEDVEEDDVEKPEDDDNIDRRTLRCGWNTNQVWSATEDVS